MLDCLPKLLVLEKLARLNHCTLLLPKDFEAMGFIKESLTLFKLEVRFLQSPITRVDNLITLSNVAKTGNYRKYLIQSLREKLEDTLDLFDGNHELIYISRSQAQKRKIANESSYTNQLESLGFKIVIFEKLTWIDQIRLMAQAKVAVSIHGAGLTNIVSMKKGSALVEIRREGDAHNNCYFSLADALSIEYYYVLARSVSIDSEISSDSDLFVNVDTLLSKLHQIIN
jgi:capsular polysaccharide biosynthesis protein